MGILIYLSYHIFQSALFLSIQPYLLIAFFIAYSFVVYKKTESMEIWRYIPIVGTYIVLFALVMAYEFIKGRGSEFWIYELLIQLSIAGTSLFIGYGLVYITLRIKELRNNNK